jgi:hypothetical protein
MNLYLGAAVLSLAVWAILLYVMQVPSGWVNVPYAAGWVLMARGIVGKTRR